MLRAYSITAIMHPWHGRDSGSIPDRSIVWKNIIIYCGRMKFDLKPEKGQHILIDKEIIERLVNVVKLSRESRVIEIGAGRGYITEELAKKAGEVIAFEIEPCFEDDLSRIKKKYSNISVIIGDALKQSWKGHIIIANIPFHLSEAAIMKAINDGVREMVLIVGENFKNILMGEEKAGFIARLFYNLEFVFAIKQNAFYPCPRTGAWIVHFSTREAEKTGRILQRVIIFNGKIKNAIISALMNEGIRKREAKKIVSGLGLNQQALEKHTSRITYKLLKLLENGLGEHY